ncbi:MAG: hypothetical protein KBT21_02665 [Treponema sp.]|nr:hypothetical protein [Candidatus Treponema merdequi]
MTLFLLTILPLSILIFYFQKEKNDRAHLLPIIFIGFFTGTFFITYKLLFSSIYYLPSASFGLNFLYYFFTQTLIPSAVIFGLFFFFGKKDSVSQRCTFFFPVLASFYSVFLPYLILETDKPYSAFYLFAKPLLFLSLFIFVHVWLSKKCTMKTTTAKDVCNYSALVIAFCFPALIESLWLIGINFFVWFIPMILFFVVNILLIFPKSNIKD